jgi:dihydropteroate synthase
MTIGQGCHYKAFADVRSARKPNRLTTSFEMKQSTMECWIVLGIMWNFEHKTPMLMGILNVTPDSFSDGGHYLDIDKAVAQALQMQEEQADIIDIGGESSRPGAIPVTEEEEIRHVIPVIEKIREKSDILISVDTVKSGVAQAALEAGANWINDISALCMDPEMIRIVKEWQCTVILMHMQETPKTMQIKPYYKNVVKEIIAFFTERLETLRKEGIYKCIVDPGLGFGKRFEDNIELVKNIHVFRTLDCPVLVGASRKSFLGQITGREIAGRLPATLSVNCIALQKGADILRVHDVGAHRDMIKVQQTFSQEYRHEY